MNQLSFSKLFLSIFAFFAITACQEFVGTNISETNAVAPVFSPEPGTYTDKITVSLGTDSPDAVIYYSTSSSDPTVNGNQYTSPFTVSATTTIYAYAYIPGKSTSEIISVVYTIQNSENTRVSTPCFSPVPAKYNFYQPVTLTCATDGAEIYYTFDTSATPTNFIKYDGPIYLLESKRICAYAKKDKMLDSYSASGSYSIKFDLPVANAGDDFDSIKNCKVILDGSQSSDPTYKQPLEYLWSIASSPTSISFTGSINNTAKVSFVPPVTGTYIFTLQVYNGFTWSALDSATVTIYDDPNDPDMYAWETIFSNSLSSARGVVETSQDGSTVVFSQNQYPICISRNNGNTWTSTNTLQSTGWYDIHISIDAQRIILIPYNGKKAQLSDDNGIKWKEQTAIGGLYTYASAASYDCDFLSIYNNTTNFRTSDYGTNWSSTPSSIDLYNLDVSENGVIQAGHDQNYIYTSTDSGLTWIKHEAAGKREWESISISADGSIINACSSDTTIVQSTDNGNTWTTISNIQPYIWNKIITSPDGTKIAVYGRLNDYHGSCLFISPDKGASWVMQLDAGYRIWDDISATADFQTIYAADNKGNLLKGTHQ